MKVEKMCAYSVSTTAEEDIAIKNAIHVLNDFITKLDETNCCTIEDNDGRTIDTMEIEQAIGVLISVRNVVKME